MDNPFAISNDDISIVAYYNPTENETETSLPLNTEDDKNSLR